MLAKFVDAEGRERWVNVRIEDSYEVKEGRRKVMFIHEIKGARVEETANPTKLEGMLGAAKIELDHLLGKKGRTSLISAAYDIKWSLNLSSKEEAEDLIRALCDVTGEYAIVGNEVVRL